MEDEIARNHNISQSDDIHNRSVDVGNHDTISIENRTNFSDELSEDSSTIENNQILIIPLKCNVCNQSFAQIEDLKYHLIGHIGITDYVSEDEIDESCDISNTNNNLNESIPNDNSTIIGDQNRESTNKADYIEVKEDSSEIENGKYNKSIDYELDNFSNARISIKTEIINETKEFKEQSDDYILKEEVIEIEEHPVKTENPIENDSEKLVDNQIRLFVKGAKRIIQQSLKTILAKPIDKNCQLLSDLSTGDRECVAIDQNETNSVERCVNSETNITENNQNMITPKTDDDKLNESVDTGILLTEHLQNLALKVQSHEEDSERRQKHSKKRLQNATSKVQANKKRPKKLSTSNQGYHCEICGKQFLYNNQLKKHLEKHTIKKTYFHCNFCHLKVLTIATLKRHLRRHIYKKQWYHCNICGNKYSSKGHLNSHLLGHSDEKPYQCEVCDRRFRIKTVLKYHAMVHTRKPHSCEVCDKKYRTKLELKDHAKEHIAEKSYSCDSCGERFLRKTDLHLHRRIHYREKIYKNKLYKCETCRKGFSRELKLRKHIQFVHYMEKLYKCNSCDESFPTRRQLSSHLSLHIREETELKLHPNSIDSETKIDKNDGNNEDTTTTSIHQEHIETHPQDKEPSTSVHEDLSTNNKLHKCETCHRKFALEPLFRKHMQSDHHVQYLGPYIDENRLSCKICGKRCHGKIELKKHQRIHSRKKRNLNAIERKIQIYQNDNNIEGTKTTGIDQEHLETHLQVEEQSSELSIKNESYQCETCNKKFPQERLLRKHIQFYHYIQKSYKCNNCDASFLTKRQLYSHSRIHVERKYQCTSCGRKFAFHFSLKVHSKQHSKSRNHRKSSLCDKCGKQFTTLSSLKQHLGIHTDERPHPCNVCHKRFKTKHCLSKHLRIHIGQKELHQCKVCGKNFSRRDNLRKHEMIHTGEKPFQCNICDRLFLYKHVFRDHLKVHTGEKSFDCIKCDVSFLQKSDLSAHMKEEHKKI